MRSYIKKIQTRLKEAGFYTGQIDGIVGELTERAVELAIIASGNCVTDEQTTPSADNAESSLDEPNADDTPSETVEKSNYTLSEISLNRLKGVNPNLVKVVKRAIEITGVDFRVQEGLRTIEQQREYVRQGKSQTMNSRHLTGHAVDLVAIVDGQVSWDFEHYCTIAKAIAQASTELGVNIRWGGAWTNITGKNGTPQEWVETYKTERKQLGKKPFLDGVHFEIPT